MPWTPWVAMASGPSRIHDAYLHRGAALGPHTGGRVVARFLADHVAREVCVVEVDRSGVHVTLIVDAHWASLARRLMEHHPRTFADFELPRDALRAVVRDWPDEWPTAAGGLDVQHSADGIPHLELVGRRAG